MHRKRTYTVAVAAAKEREQLDFTDPGAIPESGGGQDGFETRRQRAKSQMYTPAAAEGEPDTARTGFDTNRALIYAVSEKGPETKEE